MRRAAAEGLGRDGRRESMTAPHAVGGRDDRSPMVRAAMAFALRSSGRTTSRASSTLLASSKTALQVQEYLLELGPTVVPQLTAAPPGAGRRCARRRSPRSSARSATAAIFPLLEPLTKRPRPGVAETAAAAVERIKRRPSA